MSHWEWIGLNSGLQSGNRSPTRMEQEQQNQKKAQLWEGCARPEMDPLVSEHWCTLLVATDTGGLNRDQEQSSELTMLWGQTARKDHLLVNTKLNICSTQAGLTVALLQEVSPNHDTPSYPSSQVSFIAQAVLAFLEGPHVFKHPCDSTSVSPSCPLPSMLFLWILLLWENQLLTWSHLLNVVIKML